jgi:hypothetical protein
MRLGTFVNSLHLFVVCTFVVTDANWTAPKRNRDIAQYLGHPDCGHRIWVHTVETADQKPSEHEPVSEWQNCGHSNHVKSLHYWKFGDKSTIRNFPYLRWGELASRLTVSQSVCLGIERPCGTCDQILLPAVWNLRYCFCAAPSLTRGLVCNLQCNHSMVQVAQNPKPYFTVSSETPPTWRARFLYLYPPGTG